MAYPTDFTKWTTDKVRTAFGLRKAKTSVAMDAWMNRVVPPLSKEDAHSIATAVERMGDRARHVSESDIKMKLIGPALIASDFDNEYFSSFGEEYFRTHLIALDGTKLRVGGRPDIVIALGELEASLPYFCMQKYKRQFGTKSDPQGQLLIELLAARQVNAEANKPLEVLYGAFTIGRDWNFVTLEGSHYTLSKTYLLDVQQDLEDVALRLRALKYILADTLGVTLP
jgi:hypothetical protein